MTVAQPPRGSDLYNPFSNRLFNPLTTFSADWFRIPELDTLIMNLHVVSKALVK